MKDKKKIDELFEQKMAGYEAEPAMDAWPDIQDRLNADQRRKRMAYWRWATTAAAVVLAFFGGYFYQMSEPQTPAQELKNTGRPSYELLKDLPQPQKQSETRSQDNYTGLENETENKGQPQTKTREKNLSTHSTTETVAQEKSEAPIKSSTGPSSPADKPVTLSEKNIIESNLALLPVKDDPQPVPPSVPPRLEDEAQRSMKKRQSDRFMPQKIKSATAENNNEDQEEKKPEYENLNLVKEEPALLTNAELQNKNKKGRTSDIKMSMMASPTFAFRNVNINESNTLTTENVNNEEVANSFTAGLGLSYRQNKKLEWEAGIFVNQWQQSNDRLRGSNENIGSSGTNVGNITSNTSSGNVNFTELGKVTETASFSTQNDGTVVLVPDLNESYQFLDIPLSMAYYILESPRWALKLRGGLTPRILTSSEANLSYPDGQEESVNSLELRNFSLQLLAGTGVEYRLNERFHLNLQPSLQYGLTPVNQHSEVDTYFHQLLIYSGLSYKF